MQELKSNLGNSAELRFNWNGLFTSSVKYSLGFYKESVEESNQKLKGKYHVATLKTSLSVTQLFMGRALIRRNMVRTYIGFDYGISFTNSKNNSLDESSFYGSEKTNVFGACIDIFVPLSKTSDLVISTGINHANNYFLYRYSDLMYANVGLNFQLQTPKFKHSQKKKKERVKKEKAEKVNFKYEGKKKANHQPKFRVNEDLIPSSNKKRK